eukprot:scaffold70858_cov33-Phaeocystis_antarctica.AAC.2
MPGRPLIGCVFLPASSAFARPTALKNSHVAAPPSSLVRASAASSRVRTRSMSTAPAATSPLYSLRAFRYRRRHSSRSASRRPLPGSLPATTAANAASSCGASPNAPAQSLVLNARCVSAYLLCSSHVRSHLRHLSVFLCILTSFVPSTCAAPFSPRSLTRLTSAFAAFSIASSRRAALPCPSSVTLSAASAIVASSSPTYAAHSSKSIGLSCASRFSISSSSPSSPSAVSSRSRICSEL